MIKGSLIQACTAMYDRGSLGEQSFWKQSKKQGESWYTKAYLLKDDGILAKLSHSIQGVDDTPTLIKVSEQLPFVKEEAWIAFTKDGVQVTKASTKGQKTWL